MNPLESFLCARFQVPSLYDIEWYPPNVLRTSEVGRQVSVNLKMQLNPASLMEQVPLDGTEAFPMGDDYKGDPIPAVFQPLKKRAFHGLPIDVTSVCMQRITVKGYTNPSKETVGIKCNTLPRELIKTFEERYKVQQEAYKRKDVGGIRMELKPETDAPLLQENEMTDFYSADVFGGILSLVPAWANCTALLREDTLLNYIVEIPRDVCIQQNQWLDQNEGDRMRKQKRSLPVWIQPDQTAETPENAIHHWYCVPMDHILATYLYAPHQVLEARQIHCKLIKYRRGNLPAKGFFVVPDVTLHSLKQNIIQGWLSRRDLKPLAKVGFQAVNLLKDEPLKSAVAIHVNLGYMGWPHFAEETMKQAVPTCNAELVSMVYYDLFSDPKRKRWLQSMLPKK